MATVNYLFRSKKPSATLTIRLLFRNDKTDFVLSARTRCMVPKEYWEKYHYAQRVKDAKTKQLQLKIQSHLYNLETFVLNAFNESPPHQINKEWLASVVETYYHPLLKTEIDKGELISCIDTYVKFKGQDLSNSTIKKYGVVKKMLIRFQSHRDEKIYINRVDLSFKQEFEYYCLNEGYAVNTIGKAIKIIKTVCNHARKRGLEVSPELEDVKLKSVETENIYLSIDDLKLIEELDDIPDYLDNARDWLLISCHTGQRVSDFMRFNKEMISIVTNKEGKLVPLLEFNQTKTNSPISIPLHPQVLKILEKRNGNFPRQISDQPYNRFIKKVCQLAGLTYEVFGSKKELFNKSKKIYRKKTGNYQKWKLVTSHIGRRSFATNNYGSIPTSFLAYATGHKSEKMFLSYMRKNNKDMALELANYFNK